MALISMEEVYFGPASWHVRAANAGGRVKTATTTIPSRRDILQRLAALRCTVSRGEDERCGHDYYDPAKQRDHRTEGNDQCPEKSTWRLSASLGSRCRVVAFGEGCAPRIQEAKFEAQPHR
jgi:hypothetical protein